VAGKKPADKEQKKKPKGKKGENPFAKPKKGTCPECGKDYSKCKC